jgi:uncharacterized membrane protein (DUF2068 family)
VDWNLNTCARRGHETFAPDDSALADRLHATTPSGEAWRCLRCEGYVVGPPKGSGPADHAPEIPRGRLLRDRRIMRLLALERGIRGLGLIGLAVLVYAFRGSKDSLSQSFDRDLPLLRPLADQIGWNIDNSKIIRGIDEVFALTSLTLTWIAIGLLAYAALMFVEAVGLWMIKRWGEYFSVVATSVFLPWEIYEIVDRVTWLRLILLLINIVAVVWLVWSKRLFGFRGGFAAYRAEHQAASVLTVERAAIAAAA